MWQVRVDSFGYYSIERNVSLVRLIQSTDGALDELIGLSAVDFHGRIQHRLFLHTSPYFPTYMLAVGAFLCCLILHTYVRTSELECVS